MFKFKVFNYDEKNNKYIVPLLFFIAKIRIYIQLNIIRIKYIFI